MKRLLVLSDTSESGRLLCGLLNNHEDVTSYTGPVFEGSSPHPKDALYSLEMSLRHAASSSTMITYGVRCGALLASDIALDRLARYTNVTSIVVVWEPSVCGDEGAGQLIEQEWERVAQDWPIEVCPVFVRLDELRQDMQGTMTRVCRCLSLEPVLLTSMDCAGSDQHEIQYSGCIQAAKVLDVRGIVAESIEKQFLGPIPRELRYLLPETNPVFPPGGRITYRVVEPYIEPASKCYVQDAVDAGQISSAGRWVHQLQDRIQRLFKVEGEIEPAVQPCANGYCSLVLALQVAGVKEGDEVLVPSLTMVAVANAVDAIRATPVFIDVALGTYNPGLEQIRAAATPRTRAVILCHLYGVPCENVLAIAEECTTRGWTFIEDCSECVGIPIEVPESVAASEGLGQGMPRARRLGTFGDFACASLYANKMVHGADGGFVVSKDPALGALLASYANHGFQKSFHFVHRTRSMNAKINGLGAAMACGSIENVDATLERHRQIAAEYRQQLVETPLCLMPLCGLTDSPWVFGVECRSKDERTQLRQHLADYGIETRDYFTPLHLAPAYYTPDSPRLPLSEHVGSHGFYLPTYYTLRSQDIAYICNIIHAFFGTRAIPQQPRPPQEETWSVRMTQSMVLQAVKFRSSHAVEVYYEHPLLEAWRLRDKIQLHLKEEEWASSQALYQSIRGLMKYSSAVSGILDGYAGYVEGLVQCGPVDFTRPWLLEDISDVADHSTDVEQETKQLVRWLVRETHPSVLLHLGARLGGEFCDLAPPKEKCVEAVMWDPTKEHSIDGLHDRLKGSLISMMVMNLSHSVPDDLQRTWMTIRPLMAGDAVIVVHGMCEAVLPFLTRRLKEWTPIAKPHSLAKAFRLNRSALDIEGA